MLPLVLVKSFGKVNAAEVIKELLRANGDFITGPKSMTIDSFNFMAHTLLISTKYYKTEVLLFECNDLNSIPESVQKTIEGSIFYFDANDKQFLSELDGLVKFVKANDIEVSTLITRNLREDIVNGITYDQIKERCQLFFSIVDLSSANDNEETVGFEDVLDLLKNHVWSTVNVSSHNSNETPELDENDLGVEEVLNEYEELLEKFLQFKNISRNLTREEVLQYAENLADSFENLLNDD